MTIVTVTTEPNMEDAEFFRARVNGHHAVGRTAGEALDGLRAYLSTENESTLVVIEKLPPSGMAAAVGSHANDE